MWPANFVLKGLGDTAEMSWSEKIERLRDILPEMQSVLIAYSGGVDSTLLLNLAKDLLQDRVLAVTARSAIHPSREIEAAKEMVKRLGVKHLIIETTELANPKFVSNPPDRCYYCKQELFSKLVALAEQNDLNYVLDGSNYQDLSDLRPGMRAAKEFKVRSPLKEAGLSKEEVRQLSKDLGLPTWDKPALACLVTRFPYGMRITKENLVRVDEAEGFLQKLGVGQVRVRYHNHIARIEVSKEDIPKFLNPELRDKVICQFKKLGFTYITLDLQGYRSGSMNEVSDKNFWIDFDRMKR